MDVAAQGANRNLAFRRFATRSRDDGSGWDSAIDTPGTYPGAGVGSPDTANVEASTVGAGLRANETMIAPQAINHKSGVSIAVVLRTEVTPDTSRLPGLRATPT